MRLYPTLKNGQETLGLLALQSDSLHAHARSTQKAERA
jgi:hypothetical protein